MPIEKNKYDCSGCTACYNVCPVSCISMEADGLGFRYPKVNIDACIHCELCVKKCPFDENYKTPNNFSKPIAVVGKSKNPKEVALSQSGGVFATISDEILEKGGVVYGVTYSESFKIITERATTKLERDKFRGSKYVQSELGDIFKDVRKDLSEDKIVLFSGTPCQIAGLKSALPISLQKHLICIDLICHGVAGPRTWEDYISFIEEKENRKIEAIQFRDKSLGGWRSHVESFKFIGYPIKKTYTYLFYNHINLRYSCGNCPFTNTRRIGDITIGDAWGIETTAASYLGEDNKGCSLILINTPAGEAIFNSIKENLKYQEVDINTILQPQLIEPTKLSPIRKQFEEEYLKYGFVYIKRKYGPPLRKYIKNYIRKRTPSFIKQIIKK